jgi:hypothetical protein
MIKLDHFTIFVDPDGYPVRLWDKSTMPGYKEK